MTIKYKLQRNMKRAMTLSEVLIVMLLTSVVMGILVRTIVRVDPDKDKVMFTKSYHAVEEIIAASINDPTKYDQNRYTPQQIENWTGDRHFDLAFAPLTSARISYTTSGVKRTACTNGCDQNLTQSNAPCYYIAEYINTVGTVVCDNESTVTPDLRSSLGVCYWNLNATNTANNSNGSFDIVIDPSCKRGTSTANENAGYAIRINANGTMTVPLASGLTNANEQAKAAQWAITPTTHTD